MLGAVIFKSLRARKNVARKKNEKRRKKLRASCAQEKTCAQEKSCAQEKTCAQETRKDLARKCAPLHASARKKIAQNLRASCAQLSCAQVARNFSCAQVARKFFEKSGHFFQIKKLLFFKIYRSNPSKKSQKKSIFWTSIVYS